MLITFSGLDGAGKSTLIDGLKQSLEEGGYKVTILTMYDKISFYSVIRNMRNWMLKAVGRPIPKAPTPPPYSPYRYAHVIIPQDPTASTIDKKNLFSKIFFRVIRSPLMRKTMLPLDLLVLIFYRIREETLRKRVLITDRYLYDSLIDVAGYNNKGWAYIRSFLCLTPTPMAPVFVDVPAEKAFERKPEYPIDYMKWRRGAYSKIFHWVNHPLILKNENLNETLHALRQEVKKRIA